MKNTINIRRLKGLFASFLENGAMVSLAGTWKVVRKDLVLPDGALTKVVSKGGKDQIFWLSQGSLADLFGALAWRLILACFPQKVRLINRLRVVNMFRGYLFVMYRKHGSTYVVKYLKASALALSKAIAADKLETLRTLEPNLSLPRVTRTGLPRFIPSRDRRLIMGGSVPVIRFYLTLYSVYRVISIPGTLKLNTIVQACTVTQEALIKVENELIKLIRPSMFNTDLLMRPARFLWLETASPAHKVSWTGILSVPALLRFHNLDQLMIDMMKLLKQDSLRSLFEVLVGGSFEGDQLISPFKESHFLARSKDLGKLSIKSEPAGKERVFALVDVWTQTVLNPIHEMCFAFLRSLPNDGTFDQHASEMRARSKAKESNKSFGYDLTAATDRLPLKLQIAILNRIVPTLGDLWGPILVDRPYMLDITKYLDGKVLPSHPQNRGKEMVHPTVFNNGGVDYPIKVSFSSAGRASYWIELRYGTGQPMGALSSWAMLAITHHYILQLAAVRAGVISRVSRETWFSGYELLGDDIIIFNEAVAKEYLLIMDEIGVPINISKSVCANNSVTEFAKVTSFRGENVSAVSWKMFMSQNHMMGRANIAFSMLNRGIVRNRINPWIESIARQNRTNPGNPIPTYLALLSMLASNGKIPLEQVLKCLISGKTLVFRFYKSILQTADITRVRQLIPSLFRGESITLPLNKRVEQIWAYEKDWFGITLWKPLAVFSARLDLHTDALNWSRGVLSLLVGLPSTEESTWISERIKTLDLEFDFGNLSLDYTVIPEVEPADSSLNDLRSLLSVLYTIGLNHLERLSKDIVENPPQIDDKIEKLDRQTSDKDRYMEFLALVERAEAKIYGHSKASKALVDSPLKSISFLKRMSNRPAFTTLQSFD
nr:MAG: putative RNA-dependent RNA polymerase [Mitoviridae sp.]